MRLSWGSDAPVWTIAGTGSHMKLFQGQCSNSHWNPSVIFKGTVIRTPAPGTWLQPEGGQMLLVYLGQQLGVSSSHMTCMKRPNLGPYRQGHQHPASLPPHWFSTNVNQLGSYSYSGTSWLNFSPEIHLLMHPWWILVLFKWDNGWQDFFFQNKHWILLWKCFGTYFQLLNLHFIKPNISSSLFSCFLLTNSRKWPSKHEKGTKGLFVNMLQC